MKWGWACLLAAVWAGAAIGQSAAPACANCAEWNRPQTPFRIFGNTYYVGPHGLSSILITSKSGHVLIDGGLPESAQLVAASIRSLGLRIEDVKLILNSHVHFDHAGGIAELQRLSGARVIASKWSAAVMRKGGVGRGDPQFGELRPIAPVKDVQRTARRRDLSGWRDCGDCAPDARTHSGWDELDLEVLRNGGLPRHGLCGQPDASFCLKVQIQQESRLSASARRF